MRKSLFAAVLRSFSPAAVAFVLGTLLAFDAQADSKALPGHRPAVTARLAATGPLAASNTLALAISLPLRNQTELDELLRQLYDPASTNFHQFLTPSEFTARFGPTEQDYAAVRQFAESNGLAITGAHSDRAVLDVSGRVAAVEKAFQIKMNRYHHPFEAREFFAPDSEPTVDSSLPVLHVTGLDNFLIPRPLLARATPLSAGFSSDSPLSGSGASGMYAGNDFHSAYAPGSPLNGAGQTVALFELEGYYGSDITNYMNQFHVPTVALTNVLVDSFSGVNSGDSNGIIEVSLDIEMAIAMATNLSCVIVYEAQNNGITPVDILNQIVSDNLAKQISSSWLIGDNPGFDTAYKQMAAQGQSFFQASGDDGAFYSGIAQWADDTNITLVGGTTLSTTGPGGAWSSETVWNWYSTGQGAAGSGGGVNFNGVPIPIWQTGIDMTSNQGSTTLRNVPDVALTADAIQVVANNGVNYYVGGTSAAAPLWAGFTALINQQATVLNTNPVGFLNPAVYAIGKGANYAACFHDIVTGNNTNTTVGNKYFAVGGYDLCTGWGTPAGQALINMLVPPDSLLILPPNGFNAAGVAGGSFNSALQNYLLTNASAFSFTWSLVNTSAWLMASAASGALAPNSASSLTISVSAAAASLGVGNYSANVQFTNWNTHVVQTLPFRLQVLDPLIITPATGFAAGGLPGGRFNLTTQNYSLTNASATSLTWQIANTSVWLNVSPPAGTLGGGAQTNVTISLNSAASNLLAGTFSATIFFTNQNSGTVLSRLFTLSVNPSLAQNGGFETGDTTGWQFSGTSGDNFVAGSSTIAGMSPHSGSYYFAPGEVGVQAYLSQTLPTATGQLYLISLWMNSSANPYVGHRTTPNEFSVAWNGTNVYDIVNVGKVGWTNLQFVVRAAAANTVLQIGGRDDNYFLGLDDVSVIPGFAPGFTAQPTNLTLLAGSNAIFSATVTGSTNLAFQWKKNGTNLFNGAGISGAASNVLALTSVTLNSAANYTLLATNIFGATTSSVATLTVIVPATITSSSLTNRALQCGGNISYSITASGTAPLAIQWSFDGLPLTGATNATLLLTNIHLPNHTVGVAVTNLYGAAASNAVLAVQDTLPPAITLNGANPMFVELGGTYIEPGASAGDLCAGTVPVNISGVVNTGAVSTNLVTCTATDGNGNTNAATRTVIVRDTTPPTISWSFTNLMLAANSNCVAVMPDVTGANYILATDLSPPLIMTQSPTNAALLPLGTNVVVLAVADAWGNTLFSTNQIVVQDETPPVIVTQPESQTNTVGGIAGFSVAATACTPLSFRWFFGNSVLVSQTNSALTLSNLTTAGAGIYFVVATASGGSTTSAVVSLTVNLLSTSIALASSENPSGFKDSLNFTVTLTATNATGTVQFVTNGVPFDLEPLAVGVAASTNLSTLPRGTNIVSAIYSGDGNFLPATNSLAQIVTNHPPSVLPAFYTLIAGQSLTIAVADLVTNWSDADGDALFIAEISASTNGATVTNSLPKLFYFNSNYVDDQFSVAVSDGFGGTNFETVNIVVVPQTNSTPFISTVPNSGGGLTLQLTGGYGSTYILESTTDLVLGAWEPVATNTLGITGAWQFTDTGIANYPQRFFRLRLVQ